ncbi:MAG: hypothetical protein QOE96_3956 [Blastocatellia bacterium]|nr:hypothetical protein [Blastocatellia bacterium]
MCSCNVSPNQPEYGPGPFQTVSIAPGIQSLRPLWTKLRTYERLKVRSSKPEKLYIFQANQISTRVSIAVNVRYEAFPGGAADYQRR